MTSFLADILLLPPAAPDAAGGVSAGETLVEPGFAAALQALLGNTPVPVTIPSSLEGALLSGGTGPEEGSDVTPDLSVEVSGESLVSSDGTDVLEVALLGASLSETESAEPVLGVGETTPRQPLKIALTRSIAVPEQPTLTPLTGTSATAVSEQMDAVIAEQLMPSGASIPPMTAPAKSVAVPSGQPSSESTVDRPLQQAEQPLQATFTPSPMPHVVMPVVAPETVEPATAKTATVKPTIESPIQSEMHPAAFAAVEPDVDDVGDPERLTGKQAVVQAPTSEGEVLREAVTPFKRESIAVSVVARQPKAASALQSTSPETADSKVVAKEAVNPTTSTTKTPTGESFARAFFRSESSPSVRIQPALMTSMPKAALQLAPSAEPSPLAVTQPTPVAGQTAQSNDFQEVTTERAGDSEPKSKSTSSAPAPHKPVEVPQVAEAVPSKAEQQVSPDRQATGLETTATKTASMPQEQTEAPATVRYEVERPRELQIPGQIRVRVTPPELGHVRIDLTSSKDGVIGTLRFESEQAREIVGRDLSNLHRTLSDAGIRVERLDVAGVAGGESRTAFQQGAHDQQQGFSSFSRGSSQGQSQGGRYAQGQSYTPRNDSAPNPWTAEPRESVWQAPSGLMLQVNLVA